MEKPADEMLPDGDIHRVWTARVEAMEKAADEMLRAMCQFLALSKPEKLEFLPGTDPSVTYVVNACWDKTNNPLFYYCNAVYELTDRYRGGRLDEFADLIGDICAILSIMIEQKKEYPYIWYMDESALVTLVPANRLWDVLRRLAIQALGVRGWPQGFPEIPFAETGYSGVRGAVDRGKNGAEVVF
jgi:hypothetical protein